MTKNNQEFPRQTFDDPVEQAVYDMSRISGEITGRIAASSILAQELLNQKVLEARIDDLTKLYNRQGLNEYGEQMILNQKPFVAIFYDLTNFKRANDLYGHEVGDILLISAADIIRYKKRKTDIFARIGGDEFVGLIDTTPKNEPSDYHTPLERAQIVVDRTNLLFDSHLKSIGLDKLGLGISMGAVEYDPQIHESFQEVINDADRKMMKHKEMQHQEFGAHRP